MVNLFSFGCHVIDRAYVRTYVSTDCTGRVGETIKRKGGVSQACLGKSTSFILDIHNMSIDSCLNRIATDQYHMTTSRAHVSTHRGDVIYSADQLIVFLDRHQCSISYVIASLGAQLIMHTYWTSKLWSGRSHKLVSPAVHCVWPSWRHRYVTHFM